MSLFHEDFSTDPLWWDDVPRQKDRQAEPPATADVVIIGAGYTGLSAALVLARSGRDTVVLDAEATGFGCSSRNGGQVSMGIKPDFAELARKHGPDAARAILREGHNAYAFIRDFVAGEGIECDWVECGRFVGAHSAKAYEELARKIDAQPKGVETPAHIVPKSQMHAEIGTDRYHGGAVYPVNAAIDPAKLHQGMADKVEAAGAPIVPFCPASAVEKVGDGFVVTTPRGRIAARDVIVATNGYTDAAVPALRRRVIPIGSYIIATEELPKALADELLPQARVVTDTRHVVFYYRLSPDRRRMVFGGRVALSESDCRVTAPRLHAEMCRLFPQLEKARITHSWHGMVAFTFDHMPHSGRRDGMHYAMGYCGSGISMSVYFGARLAQRLLGLEEGRTAIDDLAFPTRPLYDGRPWFLAPSILFYQMRDRFGF